MFLKLIATHLKTSVLFLKNQKREKYKKMVLQYKLKSGGNWKDYPGKDKIKGSVSKYDFRLLSENRKKILVDKSNYNRVMKRFRQIEYFKHMG